MNNSEFRIQNERYFITLGEIFLRSPVIPVGRQ
jgi:hypothetical protein